MQFSVINIHIITYMKCGTSWTQEMTWLIANNLDFEAAKSTAIHSRSPFLE